MLFSGMQTQPVSSYENTLLVLRRENEELAQVNSKQQQKITFLEQELAQLKRLIFGSKRERFVPTDTGQLTLGLEGVETVETQPEKEQVSYTREKAKKQGKAVRLELPAHLPRQIETIEPENLVEGARRIGEAVTEILEYNPGKLYVKKYIRPKYVQMGTDGEGKIVIGDMPTLPIPQGNAGPGLLAHLLIGKFVDHLPFYRQVQQFKREGVKIAESTINGWFNASCRLLEPLYEELCRKVQQTNYLHGDETPLPVQSSEKKGATHTGYHWVYRAPLEKLVCFDYQKGRGREGPKAFLKNFKGTLQTDGYVGYEIFDRRPDITMLACMAHARRYFEKALNNDAERAGYALSRMQELYAIERKCREMEFTHEQRYYYRKRKAKPILKKLESWLKANHPEGAGYGKVLSESATGVAIAYTFKLWPRLKRYMQNGQWEIDNNPVENSIRPVAIGRKNYLFAGSHQAARYAAMMYSFFGTCKMNDIEPFEWLRETLAKIPDCKVSELEKLLPIR
ncbi:MAG TPA: IS66 family transposase [Cyclobacteriaceae bacterium]|nr:IS66 family transposase [Cyclobacteriaceae bacterium]